MGGTAATLRRSANALSRRRLVVLAAVAAGVWLTHGAPVSWSLPVVALGLLLLGAAERATGTRRGELERGTVASQVG